jgi:hypothetical protein
MYAMNPATLLLLAAALGSTVLAAALPEPANGVDTSGLLDWYFPISNTFAHL